MSSKRQAIKVYVTPEEYAAIIASAGKAGLSISKFTRLVTLGQQVKSIEHHLERREMRKINADLGRLGGLLKQALANGAERQVIYPLLRNIDQLQNDMKWVMQVLK